MAEQHERPVGERERLIFKTSEQAREFGERVARRAEEGSGGQIKRHKEALAEEVAVELDRQGEGAEVLSKPWEHTKDEHKEVQELVDVAFEHDLPVALKQARASEKYPRNIDLLHDVLTNEMYGILQQRGLNKQKVGKREYIILVILIGLLIVSVLMII